jgi:hypothetical protein
MCQQLADVLHVSTKTLYVVSIVAMTTSELSESCRLASRAVTGSFKQAPKYEKVHTQKSECRAASNWDLKCVFRSCRIPSRDILKQCETTDECWITRRSFQHEIN